MADIVEKTTYPDAPTAISQGTRHLLVQDYQAAVTAFAEGLEMMSQKLGECDDELGEPYLLYGRALLGLAREEAGVLGGGVPGSEDADEENEDEVDDDDDDDDDEEEGKLSEVDEKNEAMDTSESPNKKDGDEAKKKDSEEKGDAKKDSEKKDNAEKESEKKDDADAAEKKDEPEKKDSKDKGSAEQSEKKDDAEKEAPEEEAGTEASEKKDDAVAKDAEKQDGAESQKENEKSKDNEKLTGSNKTDDKKIEDQKSEKKDQAESSSGKNEVEGVAGSSKDPLQNGNHEACNGTAGKSNDHGDDDDVNNEDEEEDPGRGIDLQVAWEVLELAKIVFDKRGEKGFKLLAETHRLLGEVAMESDNPQGAIADLEAALKLLEKLEPPEPRAVAEIHYQLGLAHSLANDFDASIRQFGEATSLLETRIKQLEDNKDAPKSKDPFYTIEGEIKELRELLPAIQEKITDMKDFKEEACKLVIEGIKNSVASGSCTNGAGTSHHDAATSSSSATISNDTTTTISKPASDISHLVRKKRKADDHDDIAQSPCKKTP